MQEATSGHPEFAHAKRQRYVCHCFETPSLAGGGDVHFSPEVGRVLLQRLSKSRLSLGRLAESVMAQAGQVVGMGLAHTLALLLAELGKVVGSFALGELLLAGFHQALKDWLGLVRAAKLLEHKGVSNYWLSEGERSLPATAFSKAAFAWAASQALVGGADVILNLCRARARQALPTSRFAGYSRAASYRATPRVFLPGKQVLAMGEAGIHIDAVNLAAAFPVAKCRPRSKASARSAGRDRQQSDLAREASSRSDTVS